MKAEITESDSQNQADLADTDGVHESMPHAEVRADTVDNGDGMEPLDELLEAMSAGSTASPATLSQSAPPTLTPAPLPSRTSNGAGKRTLADKVAALVPSIGLDDRAGRALLSILLAFLLWFYVVNLENPSQTTVFNGLNVEVRGLGTGLKLVTSVAQVGVTVQAPLNSLAGLKPADIRPYVDLTGLTAGVRTITIQAEVRNSQAGGVSLSLSPNSAQVQLEIEASRELPIQVQVAGTPAFGYGVDPAQAEPNTVRITGAEDLVNRVSRIVATVDVGEKAGTQRGSKQPVALDEAGNVITGITFDPAQVQVVVPVKLLLNYKVVGVRADTRGQPAPGYRVSAITTDPNTVTICCSPNVLNNIQFLDTLPVSISGATFNVITRTELLLPQDVELYPGQTKTISVTVNVEPLVTTLQVSVAPIVEGQAEGSATIVSPDRLDLTLAGTFDQLQGLKPTDVRAFINVAGRGPGTYEIRPQVVVPQGVKLEKASPESVTVTLLAPTPVPTRTPAPTPTATPQPTITPLQASPVATTAIAPTAGTQAVATSIGSPAASPSIEPIATPTTTPP